MASTLVGTGVLSMMTGCERSGGGVDAFENVGQVQSYDSVFVHGETIVGEIEDVKSYEDWLVIKNANDQATFAFVNIETGEITNTWGRKGHGAGEFTDFGGEFDIADGRLFFMNQDLRNLVSVRLKDILEGKEDVDIISTPYPYDMDFRPISFGMLESKKVVLGSMKKGRLGVLDANNDVMPITCNYPFDVSSIPYLYRGIVFQGILETYGSRFAIYTVFSDLFEIYEMRRDSIILCYHSEGENLPSYREHAGVYSIETRNCIAGINGMAVGERGVFLLYSPKDVGTYAAQGWCANTVLQYGWNGEKIMKYDLPFIANYICLNGDTLYCIQEQKGKVCIYKINILL